MTPNLSLTQLTTFSDAMTDDPPEWDRGLDAILKDTSFTSLTRYGEK